MRIAIVGLGMIGGSIALASRQLVDQTNNNFSINSIIGIDGDKTTRALANKVCDEVYASIEEIPPQHLPDMVILATPVQQYASLAAQCRTMFSDETTITDVGSTKECLFSAFLSAYGKELPQLVGGHPIAGSEQSGFAAAEEKLFDHKLVVIVPGNNSENKHIRRVRDLWLAFGSRVLEIDPEGHDKLLAYTSHLPHLLSYSLVHYLGNQRDNDDIFRFAAGGFRDFTRIASSDPTMWSDIVASNHQPIAEALDGIIEELTQLKKLVIQKDYQAVYTIFHRAKAVRDYFTRSHQPTLQAGSQVHITSSQSSGLSGVIHIPGDKSISHRAVMFAAIADGSTRISNLLEGEDNLATVQACRDMGVIIEGPHDGQMQIEGAGLHGLQEPAHPLYMGNSGTAMRLFCGLLAGQKFSSRLTGDHSLSQRPMKRVITPLRSMGANINAVEGNYAPIRIEPVKQLQAISYTLPMASAQVKSCVLLAGLYANGSTSVISPGITRDHTERMLSALGVKVEQQENNSVSLQPPSSLQGGKWTVPGDISSAAFFIVAASIIPDSDILLPNIGINPTRDGILTILNKMGADITIENQTLVGKEPVADIRVKTAPLRGIDIGGDLITLAIDEFPALCIAAACAHGETTFSGAEELRVKESDRIAAMVTGLQKLGVQAEAFADGAKITGGPIQGGVVDSLGDHRIAMSFAVAGCLAQDTVTITDCANIATSFPTFIGQAQSLGMQLGVNKK